MSDSHNSTEHPIVQGLVRQSRWINVSDLDWYINQSGLTMGNRVKSVVAPFDQITRPKSKSMFYFWKESLPRYPQEFWSEILAYQLAPFFGVRVSVNWPATLKVRGEPPRVGSLAPFLINIEESESLMHGGDLLSRVKPQFRRKKGEDHSLQLCMFVLTSLDFFDHKGYPHDFFRQLVFDALVGNSDRHQDNWGFGFVRDENQTNVRRLLPAFDNGTSLGRELQESKLEELVSDRTALDRYIERGKAHIRWEEGGMLVAQRGDGIESHLWENGPLERVNHEGLLRRTLNLFPDLRLIFDSVISFDESLVVGSVARVAKMSRDQDHSQDIVISSAREEFIVRSILRRRERLRMI